MSNSPVRNTDMSPDRHLVLVIRPARPGTIRALKVVQRGARPLDLVYGDVGDGLVFLPFCKALMLSGLHMALASAATWGELKPLLPSTSYDGLVALARLMDDGEFDAGRDPEREPDADTPLHDLEGLMADGDFPDWPEQDALAWMPRDVQRRFGQVCASFHSGECLALPAGRETEIVAALAAHGFRCTRDDELVRRAKGFSG